jgi:YVTN family beta-propeller protein
VGTSTDSGSVRILRTGEPISHNTPNNCADGTVSRIDPGTNQVVKTIPVGNGPSGVCVAAGAVWVADEHSEAVTRIDPKTNRVVATVDVGQAPQAVVYVPDAVPTGDGLAGLQPLGVAGQAAHLTLAAVKAGKATAGDKPATSVSLFDQGLLQVLQASVTGLPPKQPHVLALATKPDGSGPLEPLAAFNSNPAGAAIVNAVGPIRQIVQSEDAGSRRYLVIVPGTPAQLGTPVQIQAP